MSALAEALVAAQRRALSAMEKAYVAGTLDGEQVVECPDAIGLTDKVDQERLIAALKIVRELGAAAPAEPSDAPPPKKDEPATDAQLALIARLVTEKHALAPDGPLTKQQAHEVIDTLKAGTYDAAKWTVPF